jgi:RHS repeat-associated protein
MLVPNRHSNTRDFHYGFQGQELDPETGMEAFQLRFWDGRIGRWLSPDPYGQHFSPYSGMGNNPVSHIDGDGGWETWLGAIGGWIGGGFKGSVFKSDGLGDYGIRYKGTSNSEGVTVYSPNFGGQRFNNSGYSNITSINSKSSGFGNTIPCNPLSIGGPAFDVNLKLLQGVGNLASGTLGSIGSGAYVIGTDGIGAPLGGAIAFTLSVSKASLGLSQIADSFKSNPNELLHSVNTLPGYISAKNNGKYTPLIDAGADVITGSLSGPYFTGNIRDTYKAVKSIHAGKDLPLSFYKLYDIGNGYSGLKNETINTINK